MREVFSSLIKNGSIKSRLGRLIIENKLPHAFLISGPLGIGKRTLALEISAALNCENRYNEKHPLPCHACNTCRRIFSGKFTDVTRIQRDSSALSIGIEDIRDVRAEMYLSPNESDYKIFIFDEADKLTVNSQNALLKVIEEPPVGTVIFLLTDSPDKILTTIHSRSQLLMPERISDDELLRFVTERSEYAKSISRTEPELLLGIVKSSEGRIGKALSLLNEKSAKEAADERNTTLSIIRALKPYVPYSELYKALSALPTSRREISPAIENVMLALRDLILLKKDINAPLIFFTSRDEALALSHELVEKRLIGIYDVFMSALCDLTRNVGISAMITDVGAKIKMI